MDGIDFALHHEAAGARGVCAHSNAIMVARGQCSIWRPRCGPRPSSGASDPADPWEGSFHSLFAMGLSSLALEPRWGEVVVGQLLNVQCCVVIHDPSGAKHLCRSVIHQKLFTVSGILPNQPSFSEPAGQMRDENLHAVVARSTFRSENVQSTSASDHFWQLRCRKSARRCGAKHISKSKCTKHTTFGPLLEVEMSKKCTPFGREAHLEVKMYKAQHSRTTFGS